MPLKCVDNVPQLNPIIRKELEIVLCLSCHYENRGDFQILKQHLRCIASATREKC